MAILGNNTPSTAYFTVDRRRWWFTRFTPTENITVDSIYIYCCGGGYYSDRTSPISCAITNNIWNYDTDIYTMYCIHNISEADLGGSGPYTWGWRGGATNVSYTLIAGITYNWWFIGGSGYSDAVDARIGYIAGVANTTGVSFVSNYWDTHNPPNYNTNYLPSTYGSGELVSVGPVEKLEGSTNIGKLEYTSWANIASVK